MVVMLDGYRVYLWGNENVLELTVTVQPCECTKNYETVYFKTMNLPLCKLYLNEKQREGERYNLGVSSSSMWC